ncbi:hypothetical protein ACJQWK_05722 [Exserohilum turcicum]
MPSLCIAHGSHPTPPPRLNACNQPDPATLALGSLVAPPASFAQCNLSAPHRHRPLVRTSPPRPFSCPVTAAALETKAFSTPIPLPLPLLQWIRPTLFAATIFRSAIL